MQLVFWNASLSFLFVFPFAKMMLGWGKIKQRSLKSRIQGSQGDLGNSAGLCSIQASAAARVLLFRRCFHVQQMWSLRVGWQHWESAPACPCRDGEVQSIPLLAIIFSYEGNDSNLIIYYFPVLKGGFSGRSGKESTRHYRRCKRCAFDCWVRQISRRRKGQPIPTFLPGGSHGQRSLVGIPCGCIDLKTNEQLSIHTHNLKGNRLSSAFD